MPFMPSLLRSLVSPFPRWALLGAWCVAGCAAGAVSPSDLQGTWEVVQVAVDQRDQPHWAWFPDDPRLLGRSLEIGAAGIALDDDSRTCTQPALSDLAPDTLQDFIGQHFPRPARFETPAAPTLHDFGLELPDAAIAPVQVRCTPDASPWNGAWLVRLSSGRLLTNYDNSGYVLVLQRCEPAAAIRASFACGKARSAVEQAICASPTLAGYDRSVAAAYRRALDLAGDDAGAVKQAQLEWLRSRDACGANAGCLGQAMRERVNRLMQQ
jgi:uncharacterized protein YecT (DUF1311 family)